MPTFPWSFNSGDPADVIFSLTPIPGTVTGTLELADNTNGQQPTSIIIDSAPAGLGVDLIGTNIIPSAFQITGGIDVAGGIVTAAGLFVDFDDSDGEILQLFFDVDSGFGSTTEINALANFGPSGMAVDDVGVTGNLDGFGGTIYECFLPGTHILTEKGEIVVEALKIGDKVQTADGKLEPIKWIGRQAAQPDHIKNPLRSYPVLIKAGALGNNLPHRDLNVSPDHSMFVEGLLINAGALVNDISILQTEPTETFTYYHIELKNHSLLIAEGAAAESYLPQKENRDEYDNCAEYEELYPHGSNLMLWPMDYPRISSWNKVPRFVSKKLLKIAHQLANQDIQLRA